MCGLVPGRDVRQICPDRPPVSRKWRIPRAFGRHDSCCLGESACCDSDPLAAAGVRTAYVLIYRDAEAAGENGAGGEKALHSANQANNQAGPERWPSGRRRSPAKGVYVKSVSRVRIPSSPPLSLVGSLPQRIALCARVAGRPFRPLPAVSAGSRTRRCFRRRDDALARIIYLSEFACIFQRPSVTASEN